MNIAIDARVLGKGITGTGRYLVFFLDKIDLDKRNNQLFLIINSDNFLSKYSADKDFIYIKAPNMKKLDKIFSPIWLNIFLPRLLNRYKIDLYFTCNILLPIKKIKNVKTVAIVHDVIHRADKSFYPFFYRLYLNFFLPQTLKNADKIITVSNYSKEDIVKFYKVEKEKIEVVYSSADKKFQPKTYSDDEIKRFSSKLNLPERFILYVGVLEKRKNIVGLVEIALMLKNKGYNIPLVLVGKKGFGFDQIENLIAKHNDVIIHFSFVDDDDLLFLYNNALVFVFPSFYEGFGLPPVEAMQCGLPVITSNTSSLPEVVGDGGILKSPNDIEGFVNTIIKFYEDKNYYKSMRLKALEQSKKFSSEKSTKEIVKVFEELLFHKNGTV
jgi:glycosyltransferase involved in cell wall biosynthesis